MTRRTGRAAVHRPRRNLPLDMHGSGAWLRGRPSWRLDMYGRHRDAERENCYHVNRTESYPHVGIGRLIGDPT